MHYLICFPYLFNFSGNIQRPAFSPASRLEILRRRKTRSPNDAVDRILRVSQREHSEQLDVARELTERIITVQENAIRQFRQDALEDRIAVGNSLERICTALEGFLENIRCLAEGGRGGTSGGTDEQSITFNNDSNEVVASHNGGDPSPSNADSARVPEGGNAVAAIQTFIQTPSKGKRRRRRKAPYTPDQ